MSHIGVQRDKELRMSDESLAFPEADAFRCRSHKVVRLGPVHIDIGSNEPEFKGFRFFSNAGFSSSTAAGLERAPDFILSLCNLRHDAPWSLVNLSATHDRSYRGKKMAAGYYLTDHFGTPAYLITRGTHYWIFADDFERILWPYAVKHLLTVYAMVHNMLHLKAAGVALEGRGALLVGRGGSGKTVLLTQLCRSGAQFLSNTHALIDGQRLLGIQTAMRVRPDQFFAPIIAERGLAPNVRAGEYTADPLIDLGWSGAQSVPITTLCLLDYKAQADSVIRELDPHTMFDYMEQFALAINVYGLKEDILDTLGGDIGRFSMEMSRTRSRLQALVEGARCYYISCDAADARNLKSIHELLRK